MKPVVSQGKVVPLEGMPALENAMRLAFGAQTESPAQTLVFLALVWTAYSGGEDWARMSLSELRAMTRLKAVNTVRAALKDLEKRGLIKRLGQEGRGAQAYRVFLPGSRAAFHLEPNVAVSLPSPAGPLFHQPSGRVFSKEVLRELAAIRSGLNPREAAKVRSKAVELARTGFGAGYSLEDTDALELEIVFNEFLGPHRKEALRLPR